MICMLHVRYVIRSFWASCTSKLLIIMRKCIHLYLILKICINFWKLSGNLTGLWIVLTKRTAWRPDNIDCELDYQKGQNIITNVTCSVGFEEFFWLSLTDPGPSLKSVGKPLLALNFFKMCHFSPFNDSKGYISSVPFAKEKDIEVQNSGI